MIYSGFFILLQSLYNLNPSFPESEMLTNFGMIHYEYYLPIIGIQCIPIIILAFYWRARKIQNLHLLQQTQNSSLNDAVRNLVEPDEPKKHHKKHKASKKENLRVFLSQSSENLIYTCRVCWNIFLHNSYYLTLIALLLCSLIEVNLFNFGYLCFFVLFLLSRRIANYFWILLVLYTVTVILIIYIWQISWTEHLDDSFAAELFGLQHFDHLISGLIISLSIFFISYVQLSLIQVQKTQTSKLKHSSAVQVAEVSPSEPADPFEYGPKTQMILNSLGYLLESSTIWICYLTLFISSMIASYNLFAM